ncbi:Nn.00g071920.m01.CDS01 [Neocucurbitaria sp. VM-36]
MRISQALTCFALATQAINAASIPDANNAVNILEQPRSVHVVAPDHTLEKRKGGGGRGGGGGSSGGGRSGGSSSGGSSRTSSSSFSGGSTRSGSGPSRAFGNGRYYGGGAAVPYSAGSRTPKGLLAGALIAPFLILAVFPGIWLYNVYPYHYNNPYRFYNQSAINNTNSNSKRATGANETLPVLCLCQEFSVCGCDENDDQQYLDDLVGNGSYASLNKTLVTVSDVNGTKTLVLNGTLPNGTTAPGGTDDDEGAAVNLAMGKYTGYWAMALIVFYGVFM